MSEIQVNTINEYTGANGVTIDGVLLKDNKIGGTITIPGSTGTMALTSDIPAGGGITGLQQFRLTANLTSNAQFVTANWEENDTDYEAFGSFISQSSGVFSFSTTGKYLIHLEMAGYSTGYHNYQIQVDSGDGTFTNRGTAKVGAGGVENSGSISAFVDVTSTSFKIKIFKSTNSGSSLTYGTTNENQSTVTFTRITTT